MRQTEPAGVLRPSPLERNPRRSVRCTDRRPGSPWYRGTVAQALLGGRRAYDAGSCALGQ